MLIEAVAGVWNVDRAVPEAWRGWCESARKSAHIGAREMQGQVAAVSRNARYVAVMQVMVDGTPSDVSHIVAADSAEELVEVTFGETLVEETSLPDNARHPVVSLEFTRWSHDLKEIELARELIEQRLAKAHRGDG